MSNQDHVKILFRFYSEVLDEWTVETMWAEIIDSEKGQYKIISIPFYAPLVASDDIVLAEYDVSELMVTYRETVTPSGNSNITVVIMNKVWDINNVRNIFSDLGCVSERLNDGYFAMEVPFNIDYGPIKRKLQELEKDGVIDYAEPCLSDSHRY
jgi:hypothetical protein